MARRPLPYWSMSEISAASSIAIRYCANIFLYPTKSFGGRGRRAFSARVPFHFKASERRHTE
eukprot:4487565-Prymnesium_polylepis.1